MISWILAAFLAVILFSAASSRRQQKPENNVIFEKITYDLFDETLIDNGTFEFRAVGRNTHKINVTIALARPAESWWLRFRLYYKYTHYQKYLIDIREDACAYLSGAHPDRFPLLKIINRNFLRMGTQFNFNHSCPLTGTLRAWNDRINTSHWKIPLLNAGRYRIDITGQPSKYGKELYVARGYFSVSDFRVWF